MIFAAPNLRTWWALVLRMSLVLAFCLGILKAVHSGDAPRDARLSADSRQEPSGGPAIRRDASLVLVNASVTDPFGRPITNLGEGNFRVFDDNKEQEIVKFSSDDVPASVGVILDTSGSMEDKFSESRDALVQFLRTANPQDEFFLAEFSDRARLDGQFTQNIDDIENRLISLVPRGRTALFDALYLGLNEMKQAENKKMALLIISDGGDNHSWHNKREVVRDLKESDVQLYAIGIYEQGDRCATPEECSGPSLLKDLSKTTGGQAFRVSRASDLLDIATKLSVSLRSQYLIAYAPNRPSRDANWHKIKVSLRLPKGVPPLTVRARTGYFATATPD
jgi:Ca-activated chloride channel homolog